MVNFVFNRFFLNNCRGVVDLESAFRYHMLLTTFLTCADPESFARGGPILITLFFFFNSTKNSAQHCQIALKAGHHRPASETAFRWRADDGRTLNAGLVAL